MRQYINDKKNLIFFELKIELFDIRVQVVNNFIFIKFLKLIN